MRPDHAWSAYTWWARWHLKNKKTFFEIDFNGTEKSHLCKATCDGPMLDNPREADTPFGLIHRHCKKNAKERLCTSMDRTPVRVFRRRSLQPKQVNPSIFQIKHACLSRNLSLISPTVETLVLTPIGRRTYFASRRTKGNKWSSVRTWTPLSQIIQTVRFFAIGVRSWNAETAGHATAPTL